MRLLSSIALLAALMSTLVVPVAAAPAAQMPDTGALFQASAQAMDGAQSMRFSGSIDMTVTAQGSPVNVSMPMSGAYQAPDRMTMSVQIPQAGGSMEKIMVGQQVWMRLGQGGWQVQRAPADSQANPLGKTHADWFHDLTDVAVIDTGSAYRVTATVDVAQALSMGYASAFSAGRTGLPIDPNAIGSQVALTIDKATSYITSMRMDVTMPVPDLSANMVMTMNMDFSDFNNVATEILPPV
jgi:hypothetical protein